MSRRNEALYHIFYGMKQRCYNINNKKYYLYGGKGIKICKEWDNDYEKFKDWSLKHGYKKNAKLSIDRINSNKNYEPDNCQWITISENSAKANIGYHKNKSKKGRMFAKYKNNKTIEIFNVSEFSRENKLNRCLVSHRLNNIIKNPYYKEWYIYREK